ncbi:MAG: HAD-IIB family hydrolase [Chromatiales bacterium]|nr:HAD-IIB family hydrolase [Chromatiales bacterium]
MSARMLLCTDLDRTLIPNGPAPESPESRQSFARCAARADVTLVYVSGRHLKLVERAIATYSLPKPAFIIADVGTSIFSWHDDRWQPWPDWEREIGQDWSGRTGNDVRAVLAGTKSLRLQERARQGRHKLSYYVPAKLRREPIAAEIGQRLQAAGLHSRLIWSLDEPAGIGLLDVLPERASKLHAIQFLRARTGFGEAEVLFAGDSGNDLEVLTSGLPSVLVANASDEIRQAAQALAHRDGHPDRLYLARGWCRMNGNYSAGILEGIAHFMPHMIEACEGSADAD